MSGKTEKDKQKALQEKHQAILCELLKLEDNKYCVDCDAKGEFLPEVGVLLLDTPLPGDCHFIIKFPAGDFTYYRISEGDYHGRKL